MLKGPLPHGLCQLQVLYMQHSELQTAYATSTLSFVDASLAALASQEDLWGKSQSIIDCLASGAGLSNASDHWLVMQTASITKHIG